MKSKFEMYYGSTTNTIGKANRLRKRETNAERLLWEKLKGKQLNGLKFRRQHSISQFIVDFYCHELKFIIEVDGEYHTRPEIKEYDENRTAELEKFDLKILRFTNDDIENNIEKVQMEISDTTNMLKYPDTPKPQQG